MVYRKGLEFLLDTLQLLSTEVNWKLLLVGDGAEKINLMKKVKHMHNGERIEFAGTVSYDAMKSLFSQSDIFVFPSLRETTGSVVFEAMANSLPVISFDQNGVSMIVDNKTGVLVPLEGTLEDVKRKFCNAIKLLLEDSNLRSEMGKNARTKIIDKYLWNEKVKAVKY